MLSKVKVERSPKYPSVQNTVVFLALLCLGSLCHPDRIAIHFDHAYPAPNIAAATNQRHALDFIREHELENFFHRGICHQVMIEEGFVAPGRNIIGADSHTNTYGTFGCFVAGFGSTEIGVACTRSLP